MDEKKEIKVTYRRRGKSYFEQLTDGEKKIYWDSLNRLLKPLPKTPQKRTKTGQG